MARLLIFWAPHSSQTSCIHLVKVFIPLLAIRCQAFLFLWMSTAYTCNLTRKCRVESNFYDFASANKLWKINLNINSTNAQHPFLWWNAFLRGFITLINGRCQAEPWNRGSLWLRDGTEQYGIHLQILRALKECKNINSAWQQGIFFQKNITAICSHTDLSGILTLHSTS